MRSGTLKRTRGSRRINISGKMRSEIVERVDREMVAEGRSSRSNTIEVLVYEALEARDKARSCGQGG